MFTKYARAVSDKTERENLHRLYRIRNTVFICFMAVCCAVILEALLMQDDMSNGQMICFGLTLLCWIVTAILSVVLFFKFRRKYLEILARPQEGGESDDVAAYRQQAAKERKSVRWALWVLIGCMVCTVVLVAIDTIKYDDNKLHGFTYAGISVALIGILVYFFALLRVNMQKVTQSGTENTPDMQNIDKEQGRTPKYRLREDKNLSSYKYIFPTPALRERAEALRKKIGKATLIAMGVSIAVSLAAVIALFSQWGVIPEFRGYAFPLFFGLLYSSVFLSTLPFSLRLRAVDAEQKRVMEQTPAFAKNFAVYKEYERFGKGKGKVLWICLGISLIDSLALAIALPDKLWSVASAVIIVAGLYLNNFFISQLRAKTVPLEKEIDADLAAAQSSQDQAAKEEQPL